ncbi:MAG: hypothetical protein ACI3U2_06740 [Anaerovibrio sp.]
MVVFDGALQDSSNAIALFADLPIDKLADLMYHGFMLYGADNEI